jgi:ecotin
MRNIVMQLLSLGLVVLSVSAAGAEPPALPAFPTAKAGMERFVIVLPRKTRDAEQALKVELTVGKDMLTDGVNLVRLANTIEARQLAGWGYTYYEVTGAGETVSTRMAPPAGAPMVKTFVTAAPLYVPYNSRLPIVVYVPTGYVVRYRIWYASKRIRQAAKG